MGRTKEQQREYMAAYRARKREPKLIIRVADETRARIADLEEEVRHLKEELAQRPTVENHAVAVLDAVDRYGVNSPSLPHEVDRINERFNTRPFTPVPKKGK